MNVITSRLPVGRGARSFPRLGIVNVVLVAALAGAGVASYFAVAGTSTPAAAPRTATVARGVVLSTTSATGTLQAADELSLGFTAAGTITSIDVKAGERVKRGQVIGHIDSTSARQAVEQAEASLANARAQYESTLTGETAQQRRQDALSITQARQSLASAKSTASQDAKGSAASVAAAQRQLSVDQGQEKVDLYQQQKDQAQYANADVAEAALNADKAQLAADQTKQQADQQTQYDVQHQKNLDQQNLSQAQTYLSQAQAAKDGAAQVTYQNQVQAFTDAVNNDQARLDALQQTLSADSYAISQDNSKLSADQASLTALQNDSKTIRSDEAKIASDRQSLGSAKATGASTAARDTQSVASAELSLRSARASVATKQAPPTAAALTAARATVVNAQVAMTNARKALADTTLRAPIAGTVAAVNGTAGTAQAGGGNTAVSTSSSSSSSTPTGIVTLTGIQGMQLTAGFAETDTAKLRVGQAATVTVDALPTTELAAHIVAIDGTATSSNGVVTYNVTFALDRSEPGLRPGMTANVDVVVGEADNVLHVPTAAVTGSGANASVTVLRKGKQSTVPVVAGLQGDSSTAILSGLKTGDTVVLPSVNLSSSSSSSNNSNSTNGGSFSRGGGGKAVFVGPGLGG